MANCIVCNNPVALNAQFFKVNTAGTNFYLHEHCARQNGLTNSESSFSQVKRRIRELISRLKLNPKKKRKPGGKASKKPDKPEKTPAEPDKKVMAQTGTERPEWAGFRIKGMVAGSSKFKIIPADTGKGKKLYVVHEFMFRKLLGIFKGNEHEKASELVKQAAQQAAVEHGKPQESRQPWKRLKHYHNVVKVIEHMAVRAEIRAKKRAKQHKDIKHWQKYYRFSPPTVVRDKVDGKYSIYLPEKKNPSSDDVVEFFGVVGGKVIEIFREMDGRVRLLFRQVVTSIKANPTKSFEDSGAAIEWAEANATDYEDPEYNADTGKWELHYNNYRPSKKLLKMLSGKKRRNPNISLTNLQDLLKWWSQGLTLGLVRWDGKLLEGPSAKRFINWWTNGLSLGIINVNPPAINKGENILDHIARMLTLGVISTGKAGVLNPKWTKKELIDHYTAVLRHPQQYGMKKSSKQRIRAVIEKLRRNPSKKRWPQRYGFDEQAFASTKAEIKRLRRMFKKNPQYINKWYKHSENMWTWSQAGWQATVHKIGKKWEYTVQNKIERIAKGEAKTKMRAFDAAADKISDAGFGFEKNPKKFLRTAGAEKVDKALAAMEKVSTPSEWKKRGKKNPIPKKHKIIMLKNIIRKYKKKGLVTTNYTRLLRRLKNTIRRCEKKGLDASKYRSVLRGLKKNPKVFGKVRCHNCGMPHIIKRIPTVFECFKCGKKVMVDRRRQLKRELKGIKNPGNMCARCGFSIVNKPQVKRGKKYYCKTCDTIMGKKNPISRDFKKLSKKNLIAAYNYFLKSEIPAALKKEMKKRGMKMNPQSEATPGFLQKYRQMKWPEIPGKIKQQIVRLVEGKQRQNPARKHIRCPICPHAKRFDNSADLLEHLDIKHGRRKNILPLLIPLVASAAPMVATAAAQAGAEVGKQVAKATAPKANPRGRRFPNGVWNGPCHKCGYKGFWKKHGRHDMCPKCKKAQHHGPSR